jgi:YbbR domain-containing protein
MPKVKREHKLKIMAFLLSVTLWYFVVWGKPVERTFEVPIQVKGALNQQYIWEINPSTVTLKLTANRNDLRKLNKQSIQIDLNLSNYPPGIHQVRIPIEKLNLPENVKIKEVTPYYVSLVIRKVSIKKIPVKVIFKEGPPSSNFKIIINPGSVNIKGFWDDLQAIEFVQTEEVDFFELKKSRVLNVKVLRPDKVLEVQPEQVKIIYLSR